MPFVPSGSHLELYKLIVGIRCFPQRTPPPPWSQLPVQQPEAMNGLERSLMDHLESPERKPGTKCTGSSF